MLLIGVTVFVALMPFSDYRAFSIGATVAVVACTWAVVTDFGGFSQPRPTLKVDWELDQAAGPGVYTVSVVIGNTGMRSLALNTDSKEKKTYDFMLERQSGEISWEPAGSPQRYEFKGDRKAVVGRSIPGMVVTKGNPVTFIYNKVKGGNYRASLRPRNSGRETPPIFITLDGAESAADPLDAQGADTDLAPGPGSGAPLPQRAEVELRGILGGATPSPRFNIYVYKTGADPERLNLKLHDVVWGDWVVNEHNSVLNTVTIGNGTEIRILKGGERLPVDFTPQSAGGATENGDADAVDAAA